MTRRFVPAIEPVTVPSMESVWFAVRRTEILVAEGEAGLSLPQLPDVDRLDLSSGHFLGVLGETECFALGLEDDAEVPEGMAFVSLRPLHGRVEDDLFWVAGRALQIVEWDRTHRFCGGCGAPTESVEGERAKGCPRCGLLAYPRIAPAAIVRVTRGDEILLACGRRFQEPIYSILAGFVEPGESLEETVVREVREETAIELRDVRYWGSQPWPFPHSLMVGFTAEHASGELRVDDEELVDAGWFTVDKLPMLPMGFSIARRLIDEWVVTQRGRLRRAQPVTQRGRRPQP